MAISSDPWENPSFDTDLEPRELKSRRCHDCDGSAWAVTHCPLCSKDLCTDCEIRVHALSSQNGAPSDASMAQHRLQLRPCNSCQDCQTRSMQFYCRDCTKYQCAECCEAAHNSSTLSYHRWFCVEGAQSHLSRYAVWNSAFKDHTMMRRRNNLQDLEDSARLPIKTETSVQSQEMPSESHSIPDLSTTTVQVKMERVDLNGDQTGSQPAPTGVVPDRVSNTGSSMGAAMSREEIVNIKSEVSSGIPTTSTGTSGPSELVDLTEDDDEPVGALVKQEPTSTLTSVSRDSFLPAVPDTERAWLSSVASETEVEDTSRASAADPDPIVSMMIIEYNRKCVAIHSLEHEIAQMSSRVERLVANLEGSMQDVLACRQQMDQLKNSLVKEKHSRNAVVARLVVFKNSSSEQLAAVLTSSTADIPDAQAASHRRCAQFEATIREKRAHIRTLKRDLEDALRMKAASAFEEVTRLGAEIANEETAIQELQQERLDEFMMMCRFSQHIRSAARNMSSSGSS